MLGYDAIATGHYAQLDFDGQLNRYVIKEGKDPGKDQSYVLFSLPHDVLDRLYLPIGNYSKTEIREIASKLELTVANKPDSQEICFIPSNDYGTFLTKEKKLEDRPGQIRDEAGNILGTHRGYYHYTVGQRKGLRIPFKHALYVTDIIPSENIVVVGRKEAATGRICMVENINWFSTIEGKDPLRIQAKIRSRHHKAWATLEKRSDTSAQLVFDDLQDAITPGQACVFYQGELILGGGWITKEEVQVW